MFIGLIETTGIVTQVNPELIVKIPIEMAKDIKLQSYIAINGRVLRVASKEDNNNSFTLLKFFSSNLNRSDYYLPQKKVNLERPVRLGEEIPGTFFYGIPHGEASFESKENLPDGKCLMQISFKNDLVKYLSVMDRICLDGALVQVINIDDYLLSFNIYPQTLSITNLGEKQPGDLLNIELDPITYKIASLFQKFQLKSMPASDDR